MAEEMADRVTPPPAVAADWSVPNVGVFTKRKFVQDATGIFELVQHVGRGGLV